MVERGTTWGFNNSLFTIFGLEHEIRNQQSFIVADACQDCQDQFHLQLNGIVTFSKISTSADQDSLKNPKTNMFMFHLLSQGAVATKCSNKKCPSKLTRGLETDGRQSSRVETLLTKCPDKNWVQVEGGPCPCPPQP